MFTPGKGKTGGRVAGTPNKINGRVRELLAALIEKSFPEVEAEFQKLTGKDKVKAFIDMLPYVAPRLQSTSLDIDIDKLSDEQLEALYNRILEATTKAA